LHQVRQYRFFKIETPSTFGCVLRSTPRRASEATWEIFRQDDRSTRILMLCATILLSFAHRNQYTTNVIFRIHAEFSNISPPLHHPLDRDNQHALPFFNHAARCLVLSSLLLLEAVSLLQPGSRRCHLFLLLPLLNRDRAASAARRCTI